MLSDALSDPNTVSRNLLHTYMSSLTETAQIRRRVCDLWIFDHDSTSSSEPHSSASMLTRPIAELELGRGYRRGGGWPVTYKQRVTGGTGDLRLSFYVETKPS